MNKIDAIILDWAGTAVDYGSFAPVQAFAEVFKEYGIEPTLDEIREPMGMLKIDHIRTMLNMPRINGLWKEIHKREPSREDADAMYGIFEEKLMAVLKDFTVPKKDALRTVPKLREMGISIGSTTGYNDKMMSVVTREAEKRGYCPDAWFSPDSTENRGRPYPYMIFRNMEALGLSDVRRVLKVGDTISDIKEGKNAGVLTAGVVIGSSQMGLSEKEFAQLSSKEKEARCDEVKKSFFKAGADEVFMTLDEVADFVL